MHLPVAWIAIRIVIAAVWMHGNRHVWRAILRTPGRISGSGMIRHDFALKEDMQVYPVLHATMPEAKPPTWNHGSSGEFL
jgi:hypothetical protein